ncbi:MAG: RNA polymerase sigma-70 factor [Bacteroidetes bacterium]|nr:RNA polymerase sigma-70 factor [Bacteroidota bacterium]
MYHELSDQELLALLSHGDANAFEAIYKRHVADLFRFARKNISSKEDCEEIIQEVFVSLWQRHKSLHILSLKYYLLNAVRYKIVQYIRHKQVKAKYAEHYKFFETLYETAEEQQHSPEDIQRALIQTISDLPERCQVAIKLRIFENLTNGEIAERMNITKRAVEVYISQAFRHFRASYSKIYNVN